MIWRRRLSRSCTKCQRRWPGKQNERTRRRSASTSRSRPRRRKRGTWILRDCYSRPKTKRAAMVTIEVRPGGPAEESGRSLQRQETPRPEHANDGPDSPAAPGVAA
jgi:hypothetical protein